MKTAGKWEFCSIFAAVLCDFREEGAIRRSPGQRRLRRTAARSGRGGYGRGGWRIMHSFMHLFPYTQHTCRTPPLFPAWHKTPLHRGGGAVTLILCRKRQSDKAAPAAGKGAEMSERGFRKWLPYLFLAAAAALMAAGILRGELKEVYRKASLICLECIGIG